MLGYVVATPEQSSSPAFWCTYDLNGCKDLQVLLLDCPNASWSARNSDLRGFYYVGGTAMTGDDACVHPAAKCGL